MTSTYRITKSGSAIDGEWIITADSLDRRGYYGMTLVEADDHGCPITISAYPSELAAVIA